MKKLLILFTVFLTLSSLSAQGFKRAVFEDGWIAGAAVSNSYFAFSDFTQETLVIDFDKMAKVLPKEGLALNTELWFKKFTNIYAFKTFDFGVFFNLDSSFYSNIPKDLFKLTSEGNTPNTTYEGKFNLQTDITFELGAWYQRKIKDISFTFRPAWFMPFFYLDKPNAKYSLLSRSDGTFSVNGSADLTYYLPVHEDVLQKGDTSAIISGLFASGGLDLGVSAVYPLFTFLDVGASLQGLPLIPARMKHRSSYTASFNFTMADVLSNFDSGELFNDDSKTNTVHDTHTAYIFRKFKLGANAAYRPLGTKLISIEPNVALAIHHEVYGDIVLAGKLNVNDILLIKLSTGYEDLLWKQRAALTLNLRIIEMNLGIGGQSQDILKSFTAGASAYIGFTVGI